MRRAAPPLLLLLPLLLAAAADQQPRPTPANESLEALLANDTITVDKENGTVVLRDENGAIIELDGNPEEIVRKKRTFGDLVFRGLADVLGYSVARKPPQAAFPPPLAPVPGIDTPLAAPAQAGPAPAPAPAPAPCGQPRAAGPPPCRAAKPPPPPPPPPPQPKAVPPCPRPRAAPRPKPKPKPTPPPPPPPPPPCAQPRANPTTPAPCAPPPPPPPPPKADNLERITSNLRLNFNFNRAPVAPATPAPQAEAVAEDDALLDTQEQFVPIAIEPRAGRLPQTEPRKPRVYVDAFVVRNGVASRVDTVDARQFDPQRAGDEDYLAYDDDDDQQQLDDDDYEDVQESRDREAAVRQFGNAVDQFWQHKQQPRRPAQQKARKLPANHYQNVHFGDRDLADDIRRGDSHQSLQRERAHPNRIPLPLPEAEDDAEVTTTTEDPKKPLKPRVLPPTEHNPNQIDTVTVRVPPIYREKRPRKLHREKPEQPDRDDENEGNTDFSSREREYHHDADGDDSSLAPRTERPAKRKRRRKQSRKTRAASDEHYDTDYDYYGKKLPVSEEEKFYMDLTVPPPTVDADVARHEKPVDSGYFLEDHERLRDDPSHRIRDEDRSGDSERADEAERADDAERNDDDKERSAEDKERTGDEGRADERERSDKLSANARVREVGYQNNYVRATNVRVDDPRPHVASLRKKTVTTGQP